MAGEDEIATLMRRTLAAILREAADAIECPIDEDSRVEARVATAPGAPIDQELLTLEQVADRLQMKPVTLRKFLRRIHFSAIQGGDTLLFTKEDYVAIRDARRKCRARSTGPAAAAPGPAPASSADVQRRLAKLRAASLQRRSGSSGKRPAAAPDVELQQLRDEYWPPKPSARSPDVERRLRRLLIENSGKHAKGANPRRKQSSRRRGRVVPFPGGKET